MILTSSDDVFDLINHLNNVFEENSEIKELYSKYKNTGFYIFETSENDFWGDKFIKFHKMISISDILMDRDEFQVNFNRISFNYDGDVNYTKLLSELKEALDKKESAKTCHSCEDLKEMKDKKIFICKKNLWNEVCKEKIKNPFAEREGYDGTVNKALILSNSEIDAHLMMLCYKIVSRKKIIPVENPNDNSLLVFSSLTFKKEGDKKEFKENLASLNFENKDKANFFGLLSNYGLFGSFSKSFNNIRFKINMIFESEDFQSRILDEFSSLSSILEMSQFQKNVQQSLVSNRISFSITRSYFFNSNFGEISNETQPKRIIYTIKNHISDRNEHKEITLAIGFENINYQNEQKELKDTNNTRIIAYIPEDGNNLNCFYDKSPNIKKLDLGLIDEDISLLKFFNEVMNKEFANLLKKNLNTDVLNKLKNLIEIFFHQE